MPSFLVDVPATELNLVNPSNLSKSSFNDNGNKKEDDENLDCDCLCSKCRVIRERHLVQYVKMMPLELPSMCDRLITQFHTAQTMPHQLSPINFCVKRSVVLKHARELTTCTSCLHSVRTLRLLDHPLLEDDGDMLRVREIHTETPKSIAKVLSAYDTHGQWMTKVKPLSRKKKRNSIRCQAHSSVRKNLDQSDWEKVWKNSPEKFKVKVASMVASDLQDSTNRHIDYVGFCRRCSANVREGYHLLMSTGYRNFSPPDGYDHTVFAPLRVSLGNDYPEKRGNSEGNVSRVVCDIGRVPELINYHTTELARDEIRHANNEDARHAMSLALVQQEMLNVVGSLLLFRIRSLWHSFLAEEQSSMLLCRLALGCIRDNVIASLQNQCLDETMTRNKKNKKKKKKNKGKNNKGKNNKKTTTMTMKTTCTNTRNDTHISAGFLSSFEQFNDDKEAELLKSMGWLSVDESTKRNDDEYLDLSLEELASMKQKLIDMKKVREQKRNALKQAWETCQLSCCNKTQHK
jgi:hypothetical protein